MAWDDLCDGTIEGKRIDLETIYGQGVDHNSRGKTGMPAAATLRQMANAARGLRLADGRGRGIAFHVAGLTVLNGVTGFTTAFNQFVRDKPGSAVCYEDTFLPLTGLAPGHVLVHQGVAPCTRCRTGYQAWAVQRGSTIVVSADEGYDRSGNNKLFLFTPTGLVFFG